MLTSKNKKILFWLISATFISLLWRFQYLIAVNIPWWDDFHGIMLPIYNLFTNQSTADKFSSFVSLNNEHRVVNDRFFMTLVYLVTGKFEMKTLALLGFINLILIFVLLVRVAKPYVSNLLFLLPVLFLIFQAQYYESLQSLMVPFQNFSVILYVFLTFYFLIYTSKNSFIFAFGFATLALFTHGNGILAFFIGGLLLIYQLKKKHSLVWIFSAAIIVGIYFIGYKKPTWSNNFAFSSDPIKSIMYIFEFLGAYCLNITDLSTSATQGSAKKILSFLLGLSIFAAFLTIILKKYPIYLKSRNEYFTKLRHQKIDLFLMACMAFVFATGILIGIARAGFPMVSRYTINSAILLALLYILILLNIKQKVKFAYSSGFVALVLLFVSYFNNYDKALFNKKNAITDGLNWKTSGTWANQYAEEFHIKLLNPLLAEPFKAGKYEFPRTQLVNYKNLTTKGLTPIDKINFEGNVLQIYETIDGNILEETNENGIYYELKSETNSYIFPAFHKKNRVDKFLLTQKYFSNNFYTAFPFNLIPKSNYELLRILKSNSGLIKSKTNIYISPDSQIVKN